MYLCIYLCTATFVCVYFYLSRISLDLSQSCCFLLLFSLICVVSWANLLSFSIFVCLFFVLPYALLHFFFSLKDLFCLGFYEYLCIHLISSHVRAHFCAPKPAGLINPFKILRLKPVRTITEPSRTL